MDSVKIWLYRFFKWLSEILLSPQELLFNYTQGLLVTQMVYGAAELNIPELLSTSPKTAEEIAQILELDPSCTLRFMRALASLHFFTLNSKGAFMNSKASNILRDNVPGSLRGFVKHIGSKSHVMAWSDFVETLKTGESSFSRVHGTSMWKWFETHPEEGAIFGNCMEDLTKLVASSIAVCPAFNGSKNLCDIAGGQGFLLKEILLHNSKIVGTILDSRSVLDRARKNFTLKNLEGRINFTEGNFFEGVPKGFDTYILKDILHDWNDKQSLVILSHIRKHSEPGTRILIIEVLVEPLSLEVPGAISDVQMMVVCDEGQQRSKKEFIELLSRAGFEFSKIYSTSTNYCLVEGIVPH